MLTTLASLCKPGLHSASGWTFSRKYMHHFEFWGGHSPTGFI